jgi:serine protease AprX
MARPLPLGLLLVAISLLGCSGPVEPPSAPEPVREGAGRLLGALPEYFDTIVVFEGRQSVQQLDVLGRPYKQFRVLPMARVLLSVSEMDKVRAWPTVRRVVRNHRLELLNAEGRVLTRSEEVKTQLGVDGRGVEVAVIDTGADGLHPDLTQLRHNWQVLGDFLNDSGSDGVLVSATPDGINLQTQVLDAHQPVGVAVNTDEYGHGTHVIGTIAGSGAASEGLQAGMAPAAIVDSYSTSSGLFLLWVLEAYDHILESVDRGTSRIQVISNSWGSSNCEFDPLNPVNVASRLAAERGILSVFAYGNSGPSPATCNPYASAPYVLGIGATNKSYELTGFSSRGIPGLNHDRELALVHTAAFLAASKDEQEAWDFAARPVGVFRPSVVAPGQDIVSAQNPVHPMTLSGTYYGAASGTSMATPHVSGIAALVLDAYQRAHPGASLSPFQLIRLLEVTASKAVMGGFDTYEAGAGFVDARAAVDRAAAGDVPSQVTSADLVSLNFPENMRTESQPVSGTVAFNSWQTHSGYVVHDIPVADGALTVKATIQWAHEVDKLYLTMYRPGADPSRTANATLTSAALVDVVNTRSLEFRFPEPGVWRIRVDGRLNAGATAYTGETSVLYPDNLRPTSSVTASPGKISGDEPVHVSASVRDSDGTKDLTAVQLLLKDGRGRIRGSWGRDAFRAVDGKTLELSLSGLTMSGPAPWKFELTATDSAGHGTYAQALVGRR